MTDAATEALVCTVERKDIERADFSVIVVTVENRGTEAAPAGTSFLVEAVLKGEREWVARLRLEEDLAPGESVYLSERQPFELRNLRYEVRVERRG